MDLSRVSLIADRIRERAANNEVPADVFLDWLGNLPDDEGAAIIEMWGLAGGDPVGFKPYTDKDMATRRALDRLGRIKGDLLIQEQALAEFQSGFEGSVEGSWRVSEAA